MKNKYLKTTTTIIIINFFGLAIIYYQVCFVIIMIHISSKPSIGVTKKYHNVNSNYNNSQLEFGKKKNHNMNDNYKISTKGSPMMDESHISML